MHFTYLSVSVLLLALRELREVGEDGSTCGVTAHHGVSCVDVARPTQCVELHCKDIGVCTASSPANHRTWLD